VARDDDVLTLLDDVEKATEAGLGVDGGDFTHEGSPERPCRRA
jgi:hypothetical protein